MEEKDVGLHRVKIRLYDEAGAENSYIIDIFVEAPSDDKENSGSGSFSFNALSDLNNEDDFIEYTKDKRAYRIDGQEIKDGEI